MRLENLLIFGFVLHFGTLGALSSLRWQVADGYSLP